MRSMVALMGRTSQEAGLPIRVGIGRFFDQKVSVCQVIDTAMVAMIGCCSGRLRSFERLRKSVRLDSGLLACRVSH